MTSKDKTTTGNVVRMTANKASKYKVLSERAESSIANDSSGIRIKSTPSGVCITAVESNLEDAVLFSDTLHSYRIMKGNNINGSCLAH